MRFLDGSKVLIPRNYDLSTLIKLVGYAIKLSKSSGIHAYLSLSTSLATVLIKGVRRSLAIPPLSFIFSSYDLDLSGLSDLALEYVIADTSWIDCKEIPKSVKVLSDTELNVLYDLGLDVIKCLNADELIAGPSCGILSCSGCLSIEELDDVVLRHKLVADLTSVKGAEGRPTKGYLRALFRNHLITYNLPSIMFDGTLLSFNKLRKVSLLGKPLVFVDSRELLLELPSRSIVINCRLEGLPYLLLRSLLYTC